MATRDTGALNEELKSEFIESAALGFAPLPTSHWDEAPSRGIYVAVTHAPRTQR